MLGLLCDNSSACQCQCGKQHRTIEPSGEGEGLDSSVTRITRLKSNRGNDSVSNNLNAGIFTRC